MNHLEVAAETAPMDTFFRAGKKMRQTAVHPEK